jgi:hypothetical protein
MGYDNRGGSQSLDFGHQPLEAYQVLLAVPAPQASVKRYDQRSICQKVRGPHRTPIGIIELKGTHPIAYPQNASSLLFRDELRCRLVARLPLRAGELAVETRKRFAQ